jgi:hypothetical protein
MASKAQEIALTILTVISLRIPPSIAYAGLDIFTRSRANRSSWKQPGTLEASVEEKLPIIAVNGPGRLASIVPARFGLATKPRSEDWGKVYRHHFFNTVCHFT